MSNPKDINIANEDWAQPFADSLNTQVLLKHISAVDQGALPMDDSYHDAKAQLIEAWGEDKYKEIATHRPKAR